MARWRSALRHALFKTRVPPLAAAATAIFLLAMVIYGIFLFRVFPERVVFAKYQVAAQQYLAHELPGERVLDFSPLYLYLNIAARKYADNPYRFLLWGHVILASFSVVFLFLLLKLFFNWTLSLVGTGAFLMNKSLILYTRAFEPEPLLVFFILGFVYFVTRWMVLMEDPHRTGNRYAAIFLAGLFLGLSVLTRSNFLPLAFLTPLSFLLISPKKQTCHSQGSGEPISEPRGGPNEKFGEVQEPFFKRVPGRRRRRYAVIFLAPILVVCLFFILRNSLLSNSVTLFFMNPGQVFYEGNNPNSWGESATYPPLVNDFALQFKTQSDFQHVVYRHFARRISNKPLSLQQVNWFWTRKSLNFILDHPLHFLNRLLVKLNFVFHNYRRHDLDDVSRNDQEVLKKVPTVPFALISAMAIFGMLFSVKRWKVRVFIYAVFFWQVGVMVLFYASDRQRVVIISMFIFFAVDLLNWMISKRKNSLVALLVLLIFPLLYFDGQLMKDETHLWQRYWLTNRAMGQALRERKSGDLRAAVRENALSFAYTPWLSERGRLAGLPCSEKELNELSLRLAVSFGAKDPSSLFDLGVLAFDTGNLAQAEYIFNLLTKEKYTFNRQYTQSSLPEFYLAGVYRLKGDKTTALSYLDKALKRNPGDPWVLARCFALTGDPVYKKNLSRYFDEIDAQFFLGKALLETNQFPEAVQCFSYVKEKLPQYRRGLIYLSLGLGGMGEYQKAVENYTSALALSQDPVFAEKEIIAIFKTFAAQNPGAPRAEQLLKMVLSQFGI
jgi:tetratricopeptide (TPR) repeat protein